MFVSRETMDAKTGRISYRTYWTDEKQKGPLDGESVNAPYQRKDELQRKRCQAQAAGTTYVYDWPELCRQALAKVWTRWTDDVRSATNALLDRFRGTDDASLPPLVAENLCALESVKKPATDEFVSYTELVLDQQGTLQKTYRPIGLPITSYSIFSF